LTERAHTAKTPDAGALQRPLRPARWSAVATVLLWSAMMGGFAIYVLNLSALQETYGGVGTGVLLVMWVTLFSLLYYAMPRIRIRADKGAPAPSAPPPPADRDAPAPTELERRVDLVTVPSAALRNPTAQGRMMSALGARAGGLAEHEIELMSWGFAYGVAWAVARRQDPDAREEVVSARALQATEAVYEAFRGRPRPAGSSSAPHPDTHGG
jgi:hypothetical protein